MCCSMHLSAVLCPNPGLLPAPRFCSTPWNQRCGLRHPEDGIRKWGLINMDGFIIEHGDHYNLLKTRKAAGCLIHLSRGSKSLPKKQIFACGTCLEGHWDWRITTHSACHIHGVSLGHSYMSTLTWRVQRLTAQRLELLVKSYYGAIWRKNISNHTCRKRLNLRTADLQRIKHKPTWFVN